ncbi:hypothetical protein QBC35DRAFT_551505 [Podospora australis]|uniref:Rad21/Rec8-like protein N-terminal domain-containing protein n=1 Tax=Podospora australis TaxID=1536484 RepID=A0AAN6X257_9PEZI|nr:hypothetical protein QBC35DRAFT_551505 [Podospora australis]
MFYSHEILTSRRYGVATVWLVSTVGIKSGVRKISRKAIEEVNVVKACDTILQPGAPIALRLQGSLLYGVSRVYSQQCQYVLSDAERVQAHMRAFYDTFNGDQNALDPKPGKSRRSDLMLQDDPDFVPNFNIPVFHFDDEGNLIAAVESQASRKTSSQLSPLHPHDSHLGRSISLRGDLDLSNSFSGENNSLLEDPFGMDLMEFGKDGLGQPFGDDQVNDDWHIEIDAEGNVVPIVDEPELPQLPRPESEQAVDPVHSDQPVPFVDDDRKFSMGGTDPIFPIDPIVPAQEEEIQPQQEEQEPEPEAIANADVYDEAQAEARPRPQRRQRRRAALAADDRTQVPGQEIRSWAANYVEHVAQPPRRRTTTATEARRNAFLLTFGRGIGDLGALITDPNLSHPLMHYFAGEGLQARLLGIAITDRGSDGEVSTPRGRRRTSSEALDLDEEETGRRVRRRISGNEDDVNEQSAHIGLQQQPPSDAATRLLPPSDAAIETGREAGSALPDIHSDVPWNRASSQILSSAVKAPGSSKPGSRQVSASPLAGRNRGSGLLHSDQAIERFSDQPTFGSDGFGPLYSQGSIPSYDPAGPMELDLPGLPGLPGTGAAAAFQQDTSQGMRDALDREGRNFFKFIQMTAKDRGYPSENDVNQERQWVDFDDLFEPEDRKRAVIAQAFHHVLCLATKNVIKVKQDGQNGFKPFGTIRMGVELTDEVLQDDNDDDQDDY